MTSLRYKYPRTPHLPWSPGASKDDLVAGIPFSFPGNTIVITEKMDGENTTIYRDGVHARSIDSRHHPSRNWVKQLQGRIGYLIPEGWRLCGENLFARHSLEYESLEGYFYLFSIWNQENICLSWQETIHWAEKLALPLVPEIYRGTFDEQLIRKLKIDEKICEGYVVRTETSFNYSSFKENIAKWVRPHHVTTDKHWMHSAVVPNKLKGI